MWGWGGGFTYCPPLDVGAYCEMREPQKGYSRKLQRSPNLTQNLNMKCDDEDDDDDEEEDEDAEDDDDDEEDEDEHGDDDE